jgi:hypothetical protein
MYVRIHIEGDRRDGRYEVTCHCGTHWRGQALRFAVVLFDPALPIAEAVAHAQEAHPERPLVVDWSEEFRVWLLEYWDAASRAVMTGKRHGFSGYPSKGPHLRFK